MNKQRLSSESGQTLVLVVLGFLAFVAMLALVLDGGNAYAAKRQAQNAADAGALAGASFMCKWRDSTGGEAKARDYAIINNSATSAEATANLDTVTITVTATVTKNTFFAGVIGYTQVSPRAVAVARCLPPGGKGVLPVAWACRNTVEGGVNLPGIDCAQEFGPSHIYILMDSVKVAENHKGGNSCDPEITDPNDKKYCYCVPTITDPNDPQYCQPQDLVCSIHGNQLSPTKGCDYVAPNTTDCDLDNDCIDELMTGGARSWLDLDGGGGGANELKDWIINGFPNLIPAHKWLPEESGVATSIFRVAEDRVGYDVILPVFDKLCPVYPTDTTLPETRAACNVGPTDDRSIAGNNMNFHIASFSLFHVTCVQTGKNKAIDESGKVNGCPGHDLAESNKSIDDNDKTLEGYFITGQIPSYGGSGELVDVGTFSVALVR